MKILKILKYKEKIFPYIVGLLIFIHIFILLQLMFFPYPELFIYSYLTDKGLLPYKQIIDQHFPGVMFLPINLYSLGIDTLQEMRMIYFALIISSDLIFTKILKKIFNKNVYMLLGFLLYIFWQIYFEGHVFWIESFITPLILLAFGFLLNFFENRRIRNLYFAALSVGIALVFKQTVLPLAGLVFLYLFFKRIHFKNLLLGGIIFIIPILLVTLYFSKIGVLRDFFYWTVTFNLTIFNEMGKTRPDIIGFAKILPVFGVSVVALLYYLIRKKDNIVNLTGIFLFGCLFFAYARFDHIHLQPALPFALILLTMLIVAVSRIPYPVVFRVALSVAYCILSLYIFIPNFRFYNKPGVSPMFNDAETAVIVEKVKEYSNKGDTIFAFGTHPHIYYLTETMPPGNVFTFQFPWFMKVAEQTILTGIVNSPPKVVIRDLNAEVGGYSLAEYMQDIDQYIVENYVLVDYENNIEVLVKI
ncbi:MAG: hypothetical protein US95_C0002G0002 [Candidatus Woesebacteria bacterium GW2011_GWB1_38_5]|uniref:Uncharacterized protein n=3 Tax=Candidatus Woeseibacteriota TaxID=1752722 RepID=A0A0G0NEJ3_9BACT|nr:MAG: hypothetical protein US75_C0022G0004 [Candidatus Woesebacteria bacterium GW2011_GWC1_38_13]KKQ75526.1 MAG: hypothetical protein US95_C0002G0002 [Candidatus Woesebacteria bacterium GW2011_GWB1_38_5]KKQ75568.1 MAG: hypothetical protein US97_C0038G0006 [Microgenomates group bacterium GW2011_GWF1_38_5]